jgi:glycosyltransferase involved in cell wall biosynthesis
MQLGSVADQVPGKLNIVFLCGSLEPGRDGVGDYTRRLANELVRQGHQAAMVALNDPFIIEEYRSFQNSESNELAEWRIPSLWPERKRFSQAKMAIDEINPTWISLQFVIFSFHPKGIPYKLQRNLAYLIEERPFHCMFHELWVGLDRGNLFKSSIISSLQKLIIKQMIHLLKPMTIHTHLPAYSVDLENLGLQVSPLPLFSNIEVTKEDNKPNETCIFRLGFFSQAEVSDAIAEFLKSLGGEVMLKGLTLEVLLIGGSEEPMNRIKKEIEDINGYRNGVKVTGFLTAEALSKALSSCAIGVSPVPRHSLGKSGSVAAFMAHGIPVAAPNVHPGYSPEDVGFFSPTLRAAVIRDPQINMVESAKKAALEAKNELGISTIAEKFQSDIQLSSI